MVNEPNAMLTDLREEAEREMLAWVVRYHALGVGFTPMSAIFYTAIETVRVARVTEMKRERGERAFKIEAPALARED